MIACVIEMNAFASAMYLRLQRSISRHDTRRQLRQSRCEGTVLVVLDGKLNLRESQISEIVAFG